MPVSQIEKLLEKGFGWRDRLTTRCIAKETVIMPVSASVSSSGTGISGGEKSHLRFNDLFNPSDTVGLIGLIVALDNHVTCCYRHENSAGFSGLVLFSCLVPRGA